MGQNDAMLDRIPVLALGFRPFYLAGAVFAVLAVPLWLFAFVRGVPVSEHLPGVAWHSHEMIFGFAAAVIAGFLLTAVRNWTGRPTPVAGSLAALVALWLLARILLVTGPAIPAAIVDALFIPALALAIARPIWRSRNARNYKIVALLVALAMANIVYQLAALGRVPPELTTTAATVALDLIVILFAIIGGRVIPAFIGNAIEEATPRHLALVEYLSFGSLLALLLLDIAAAWTPVSAGLWISILAAAALAHAVRLLLFQPLRARGNFLLLMLPLAYAWLPVTFAVRAFAVAGLVPSSAATHALTIGAIAALMMAMMTRSSLGHSGRALAAGKAEVAAFLLLQMAAVVRLLGTSVAGKHYFELLVASGTLWAVAFAVFLLRYAPILVRPRVDGRPG